MFSVNQPWDPLKVCVVGKSYPPEFYSWVKNPRLRNLFERIAIETEEDYQNIINKLQEFGVEIVRPNTMTSLDEQYISSDNRIPGPVSMNPRDTAIMIGNNFYFYPTDSSAEKVSGRSIEKTNWTPEAYNAIKGIDWPSEYTSFETLPDWIKKEIKELHGITPIDGEYFQDFLDKVSLFNWWTPMIERIQKEGNNIITNFDQKILSSIPTNGITRIGKDLFFGCSEKLNHSQEEKIAHSYFQDYNCHYVYTGGHIDGCFSPVTPGLILSINDMDKYKSTFPHWEVVYLQGESWSKVKDFLHLKKKNHGRWWIKDYEKDNELIDFVETWLNNWVGYVEETVFDVNILTIDEKNVIVNGYNKKAFDAFARHGITPHICPVRHRYFWDGGIHCVTLDLHRQGDVKPFPLGSQ